MSSEKRIKLYRRLDLRLTFSYSCAFLVTTLIICAFLYYRMRHNLLKEIDRLLSDEGREIAAILLKSGNPNDEEIAELIRDSAARRYYQYQLRIMDSQGNVQFISRKKIFSSLPITDDLLKEIKKKRGITETKYLQQSSHQDRIYTFPLYQEGEMKFIIQIVTTLEFVDLSLRNLRANIIQAIPLVLILGALGGWLLARGSLKPIGEVTQTARRITATNLSERIALHHTGDELDELILTINDMIARIEDAFKRIMQFTADASHELRTPLCSLKGEIEVILSQDREGEEYKKTLIDCAERLEELAKLLNGLLFLARADEGMVINTVPLSIDDILINLFEFFEPLANQKGITISLDKVEKVCVMGDKTMLQQLFTNLIDNAIKYTPENGSITIGMNADQEMVKVFVRDSGIGIPEGDLPHIFKRFYRVDQSRARKAGGSGLGLSICHFIVEAHRGKIKVESEVNRGSTFTVYFPKI